MPRFPSVGEVFGDFRITESLGQGAMGVVYAATQVRLSRAVALKVLNPQLSTTQEYRDRFVREAETLSRLDSPHIIHIYDYGDVDGCLYLATQLVRGGDLSRRLSRGGPLPVEQAVTVASQVASALADAHGAGVLHRDVKAQNVLLHEGTRTFGYLCDFGIAHSGDVGLTSTGVVIGTWAYLAPERCNGEPASAASDIYSLGCLLYAMLAGHTPFTGSEVQVAMGHVSGPVPQLAGDDPTTTALNEVLRRALAKDPRERYSSAGAMQAALDEVGLAAGRRVATEVSSTATRARPVAETILKAAVSTPALPTSAVEVPARRRGPALLVAGAVALVAAIGVGAALAARAAGGTQHHSAAAGATTVKPGSTSSAHAATGAPSPTAAGGRQADARTAARRLATLSRVSYDGDSLSDVAIQSQDTDGRVLATLSDGSALSPTQTWTTTSTYQGSAHRLNGDFDGDGRTDVAVVLPAGSGQSISVGRSTGSGFAPTEAWGTAPAVASQTDAFYMSGDFDGDGRGDVASVSYAVGGITVDVLRSTGTSFASPQRWADNVGALFDQVKLQPGDVNADGRTDIIELLPFQGGLNVRVLLSTGSGFARPATWAFLPGVQLPTAKVVTGDFDHDGVTDALVCVPAGAGGTVAELLHSTRSDFDLPVTWTTDPTWTLAQSWISAGDFDGDGRADLARISPAGDGVDVSVLRSTGSSLDPASVWQHVAGLAFKRIRTLGVLG